MENSKKGKFMNDLNKQARNQQKQIDWIRLKLEKAEQSGFTSDSKSQILQKSKDLLNGSKR
jgi:antitoxin ParD1/3/4